MLNHRDLLTSHPLNDETLSHPALGTKCSLLTCDNVLSHSRLLLLFRFIDFDWCFRRISTTSYTDVPFCAKMHLHCLTAVLVRA
ncbi:hypothetical protein XENTR_v10014018 [Xenopus tropicalis]|nr:hypothetical protein XENTR_v10014018 [Xenopus tropicalis]